MRDEKEERKKQARSNKQTRQSNTAHPRQSLFLDVHTEHRRDIVYHTMKLLMLLAQECTVHATGSILTNMFTAWCTRTFLYIHVYQLFI